MAFVGAVGTSYQAGDDEFRIGTTRPSMNTNPLLAKAELGKVKKTTFSRNDPDHVFGYMPAKDPEGVREVVGIWKESDSASKAAGKGVYSDFQGMNKSAAIAGLTTAKEMAAYRASNPQTRVQKAVVTSTNRGPTLPSDKNPAHTYGLPSAHRSAEVIRDKGPEEPPVKHLVQNAYEADWMAANAHKGKGDASSVYIPPVPTRAALGHAIGAQKYLQPSHTGEEWKMTKFKNVPSKVTAYMGSTARKTDSLDQFMEQATQEEQQAPQAEAAC